MIQNFDIFDRHEMPNIWLCNPNQSIIGSLKTAYDINPILRFNDMSELNMVVPYMSDSTYTKIESKRLIYIEDLAYFLINDVVETNNGIERYKTISATSLECELNYKHVNLLGGTYKFYDAVTPENSLLGVVLNNVPNWTIGTVDAGLLDIYRTFDIADMSLYQFLTDDVSNAYECIFVFDTINRTVNAYELSSLVNLTDIYMSKANLINSVELTEISDEIVTCLKVYGDDSLNIAGVNPLGNTSLYNFDYFKTTEWMSQSLIDAIDAWEADIASNLTAYQTALLNLKTSNGSLLTEQTALDVLYEEMDVLQEAKAARMDGGLDLTDINADIASKQGEIDAQIIVVEGIESDVAGYQATLASINSTLAMSSAFTSAQLEELSPFIIESTYQNTAFIATSTMTDVEIQEKQQELYDYGISILSRVSIPRYSFTVDSANFIYLKEFTTFTSQLELGAILNIQINDSVVAKPILLEINYFIDNPTNFSMTFGNRYKITDSSYIFSDLVNNSIKSGITTQFEASAWNNFISSGSRDALNGLLTEAWDCSVNQIISSNNQQISIGSYGLIGKRWDSGTETYDPQQIWITGKSIVFTEDSWDTASLAIGEITFNGNQYYGVVAEALIGDLIAGSQLVISNSGGTFEVDASGATLYNADLTIVKADELSQILMSSTDGIKIQGRAAVEDAWTDKLWADTSGNLNIVGIITADSGNIGGWSINTTGLTSSTAYITPDSIKLNDIYIGSMSATGYGIWYGDSNPDSADWKLGKITGGGFFLSGNGGESYLSAVGGNLNIYTVTSGYLKLKGSPGVTGTGSTVIIDNTTLDWKVLSSSMKYKKNIIYQGNDFSENIDLLKPVQFSYKDEDIIQYGFIAEDVVKVYPNLVLQKKNDDGINEPDDILDRGFLAILVNEVQNLRKRVKILESEKNKRS